ncbi:MAG: DUF1015 domain-containing protein [Spirochaetaceae bacterium]|jgi:uncharacterized protein (DUF1015 family)|nr:DUF1015 domain-containing protein [Spirochaetaceae bacterium]
MSTQKLESLGVKLPEILLPAKHIALHRWAVIACDQFTQVPDYWEAVRTVSDGSPSTINLILPEAQITETARIQEAHRAMRTYLADGTFAPARQGCVYIERRTHDTPLRRGIVLAIDLEQYDWQPETRLPIRSTEGTVPERLPARMALRRDAALETSHVILLINDEEDRVISSLAARAKAAPPIYRTDLGIADFDSGSISGWFIDAKDAQDCLAESLEHIASTARKRYGNELLFAVGDGNHSLASAKGVWEEYKLHHAADAQLKEHPARWALVEIENLYDPGIHFEPIHRILSGIDAASVRETLLALPSVQSVAATDKETLLRLVSDECKKHIGIVAGNTYTVLSLDTVNRLVTVDLQPVLDKLISQYGGSLDYIHGSSELFRLLETDQKSVGLVLPPVIKSGFFDTIAAYGPLPRKSFSMGEAEEKRFYLECRKLF